MNCTPQTSRSYAKNTTNVKTKVTTVLRMANQRMIRSSSCNGLTSRMTRPASAGRNRQRQYAVEFAHHRLVVIHQLLRNRYEDRYRQNQPNQRDYSVGLNLPVLHLRQRPASAIRPAIQLHVHIV